ncbi:MAG: hypothetical protein V7749_03800 [Cocleimonas sp.]
MFRFTLIPLVLLFGGIIFSLIGFVVYRKIKRGVKYTYDKSTEISSQYMDKWRSQEQRKKLPEIVQKGFDDYKTIENTISQLPPVWQLKLTPLKQKSNQLLSEISQHLIDDESFERTKLTSLRSFFNHSLDAFKQFTLKLLSDHEKMSDEETQRAKENIKLIYNDLLHHEKILHKKRKFEFDVLMDVIKARLKS